MKEIPDDLIIKNLAGESSPDEDQMLWDWMESDPEHQKIFNDAVNLYCSDGPMILEAEIEKRLIKLNRYSTRMLSVWWDVAASFVLVCVLSAILVSMNHRIVEKTSLGEVKQIILPDGSRAWLNGASMLGYDEDTFKESRQVFLKGEAYFEVTHSTAPFVIEYDSILASLDSGAVNIQSYPTEVEKIAVVGEGIVTFHDLRKTDIEVVASTEFEVRSKSDYGLLSRSVNSNVNYKSWFTGVYVFNDEPIERVIHVLGKAHPRWNINKETLDRERLVSGVFRFSNALKSKEEIMRIIDSQNINWEDKQ